MRTILFSLILLLAAGAAQAQSSMSDRQIYDFVVKEHEAGTSQQQIVTKLMQRGVTVDQIRRLKRKYERQMKGGSLGGVDITSEEAKSRLRQNNAKTGSKTGSRDGKAGTDAAGPSGMLVKGKSQKARTWDEQDEEFLPMIDGLTEFMPDSVQMYNRLLEKYNKEKSQKKVFGRDIFNNTELTFEPPMNIATPENYRLGPGDEVFVDVYGASQKTETCTVSPDGTITIEGFGPVAVGGLSVSQANARLRQTLGARYSSSKIRLTVGQTKTLTVNVMGEVSTPGTYTLSAFATVFHALYMAGGISDIGTLRAIKVYRGGRLVSTVDIYDYILNGRLTGNVRLAEGDVIVVGPYECLVDLTGKVKRPMYYEMKPGESLASLIKYAGGFAGDAYRKAVRLTRKAGSQYTVHSVGEFDMAQFRLCDGDSVDVDSVLPRFANTVEIKGAVFRPGKYELGGDITTVRGLIEKAEGLTEDAFTARGVMHRMKPDRTLEVLAVDVAGLLGGDVADIPLRNEDVLFVPSKKELQEEQVLTIHGEVMYPGVYRYADNETVEDFILQAGGLKNTASMMKVDVARRVVDPLATTSSDTIAATYSFKIKDGFVVNGEQGFRLRPFDEVFVRTSPGYSEQQNVYVEGEVLYAGTYTLAKKTQRLSDVIRQAGGPTGNAFVSGARLIRQMSRDERLRQEQVLKIVRQQAGNRDSIDITKLDVGQAYNVGINLDMALAHPGSNYDVVLREGDRIVVPQFSNTVKISGDVMYPNTVAYSEGKKLRHYIEQAGGYGNRAKRANTLVVYMNGTVATKGRKLRIEPGCEIIVPSREAAQRMSAAEKVGIATGTASIATMFATIANLLK